MFHPAALIPSTHIPTLWRVNDLVIGTCDTLALWRSRRRDRRQLLSLDDHMLRDIGLSRADAFELANRPFWRS